MTPQELKNSILQLAIQGKLVEYWGGTLWEVAVLAGIGVDFSSYRGLVVDMVALAWRRSRGRQGRR